jgi:hypothetical protein
MAKTKTAIKEKLKPATGKKATAQRAKPVAQVKAKPKVTKAKTKAAVKTK